MFLGTVLHWQVIILTLHTKCFNFKRTENGLNGINLLIKEMMKVTLYCAIYIVNNSYIRISDYKTAICEYCTSGKINCIICADIAARCFHVL